MRCSCQLSATDYINPTRTPSFALASQTISPTSRLQRTNQRTRPPFSNEKINKSPNPPQSYLVNRHEALSRNPGNSCDRPRQPCTRHHLPKEVRRRKLLVRATGDQQPPGPLRLHRQARFGVHLRRRHDGGAAPKQPVPSQRPHA